jgi:hypothetical protein
MREIDGHVVSSWERDALDQKADRCVKIKAGKGTHLHPVEQAHTDTNAFSANLSHLGPALGMANDLI